MKGLGNLSLTFITSRDASGLRVFPGLRNALGVVLALAIGTLTGDVLVGLAMAIGAQVAGFAGLNGTARRRFRTMLFGALWMGSTTFIGGFTGGTGWAVAAVTILGFGAGLLVCVSNEAGLVGLWGTIAFIIMSQLHGTSSMAAYHALLVLAGGFLQMLLMMLSDPWRPLNAETRAIALVFDALARYAREGSRKTDLGVATALLESDARLVDSFLSESQGIELRELLDRAESVRIEMVAIQGTIRSLGQEGDAPITQDLKMARVYIADLLSEVAEHVMTRSPWSPEWHKSMCMIRKLGRKADAASRDWMHAYAGIRHVHLDLAHVHEMLRGERPRRIPRSLDRRVPSPLPALRSAVEAIRANLTFRSSTFRHAVRLGLALCLATVIGQVSPISRGYWLPLTTLVILKPEFTTTFSRGVSRVLGTLIGALFGTLLLAIPDPVHALGVALVGLLLWGVYTVINYNLVLFACLLTAEVVVLLSFFENTPLLATTLDRAVYTIGGSFLAFLAYLLWPTWQHRNVPDAIAAAISALRSYLEAIFGVEGYVEDVASCRKLARLTRTNAVNLVHQAFSEPARHAWDEQAVQGLLTALHRFSDALLSLESYWVGASAELRCHPDIAQFGQYVNACLRGIEAKVRSADTWGSGKRHWDFEPLGGTLDEVSPFTKQQLQRLDVSTSLVSILIRMEENLSMTYRMVSSLRKMDTKSENAEVE